jgi:hypothetical protein
MSTRSRLGIVNDDGTITSIYVHYDGYLDHHGPILLESYNTRERVLKLMRLGDLSVLRNNIGEKHSFDDDYDIADKNKWCTAYGRDRHEEGVEAAMFKDVKSFQQAFEEYNYLFLNNVWFVDHDGSDESRITDDGSVIWTPLTVALQNLKSRKEIEQDDH